jgi:hypothetical protein
MGFVSASSQIFPGISAAILGFFRPSVARDCAEAGQRTQ